MRIATIICFILGLASLASAQTFSLTFDEIIGSNERGKGIAFTQDRIFVTSGARCNGLTNDCTIVYCYDYAGNVVWKTILDTFDSSNVQNISYQSDTLYLSSQVIGKLSDLAMPLLTIDALSGEQLDYFISTLPDHLYYFVFGHTLYNDELYAYGGATVIENPNDDPAFIHRMDKKGNYIDHLEFRQDNYNLINNVTANTDNELVFICSSSTTLTDSDDLNLVKYDAESSTTDILHTIPNTDITLPYFAVNSSGYVIYDDNDDLSDPFDYLYALRGVDLSGDLAWTQSFYQEDPATKKIRIYAGMTTCANDDILIYGRYANVFGEVGFITRFSPLGEIIWEKHYLTWAEDGEVPRSWLRNVRELPDGSIIGIGQQDTSSEFNPDADLWVIKVDANGCLDGVDCSNADEEYFVTGAEDLILVDKQVILYPNPASLAVTIRASEQIDRIVIRDYSSRIVAEILPKHNVYTLDVSQYNPGLYLVESTVGQHIKIERLSIY